MNSAVLKGYCFGIPSILDSAVKIVPANCCWASCSLYQLKVELMIWFFWLCTPTMSAVYLPWPRWPKKPAPKNIRKTRSSLGKDVDLQKDSAPALPCHARLSDMGLHLCLYEPSGTRPRCTYCHLWDFSLINADATYTYPDSDNHHLQILSNKQRSWVGRVAMLKLLACKRKLSAPISIIPYAHNSVLIILYWKKWFALWSMHAVDTPSLPTISY